MQIGIINNKQRAAKVIGSFVTFTLKSDNIKVEVVLESDKRVMTIITPSNPLGEVHSNLPENGYFIPAIMNKTAKADRNIKIMVKFDFANA